MWPVIALLTELLKYFVLPLYFFPHMPESTSFVSGLATCEAAFFLAYLKIT